MIDSSQKSDRGFLFFILCNLVVLLSIVVSPPMLNTFINYTTPGGGFLEKLHPSTYLVLLAFLLFSLKGLPIYNNVRNYYLFFTLLLLITYVAIIGNFGYMAVLIDIFLGPALFSIITYNMDRQSQAKLLQLVILIAVLNTILVAGEFVGNRSLLNYEQEIDYFRPAGIFGHPIATGAICCTAMLACHYIVKTAFRRRMILALLLAQVAMCGVRAALLVAAVIFFADIITQQKRTMRVIMYDMLIFIAIVLAAFVFESLGVFDRILAKGIWDNSAASRFDILHVFAIMSTDEFWFGTSPERALMYARSLNYTRIENSFVVAAYQCGFIFSIIFIAFIILVFFPSIKKSLLFLILFLFVCFGTLYFAVKSPVNYPLFLLGQFIATAGSYRASNSSIPGGGGAPTEYGRCRFTLKSNE